MKLRTIGFAVVAACALVLAAPAVAADQTVRINSTGFTPLAVSVDRGDAVTWRNVDSDRHQVVADNGAFRSPVLEPGQTYTFEFNRGGTFMYSDALSSFRKGTVTVGPVSTSPSLTMQASKRVVTFGATVVLSGTVSNGEGGELVRVTGDPYRGSGFSRTVTTDADGVWRLVVRPSMRTSYRAFWRGQESSTEPLVHVRARVGLSVRSRTAPRLYTRAFAAYSYRGKLARVQRQALNGGWVNVRFVRLNSASASTFVARIPRGATRVRVVVPSSPGYLTGISSVRIVRR
jgi:plastocyanin